MEAGYLLRDGGSAQRASAFAQSARADLVPSGRARANGALGAALSALQGISDTRLLSPCQACQSTRDGYRCPRRTRAQKLAVSASTRSGESRQVPCHRIQPRPDAAPSADGARAALGTALATMNRRKGSPLWVIGTQLGSSAIFGGSRRRRTLIHRCSQVVAMG